MSRIKHLLFVLVLTCTLSLGLGARLFMDKCEPARGFDCVKVPNITAVKYDVTFTCNTRSGWDVEFHLWQFRSIAQINSFTIANCTKVTLHLYCTSEIKHIQFLRVTNVTKLTIPTTLHGLMHTPPEVIFEDIEDLERIYSRTFIQLKKFQFSRYGCSNPTRHLESVVFRNVKIGIIEKEGFYNLTNFRNFTFEHVSVNKIEQNAAEVFMEKNDFIITKCNIGVMEFLSFHVRGTTFSFLSNIVKQIHTSAIKAAVYNFNFVNNTVSWLHFGAFSILSKNVKISDSVFEYLNSGSFQGIGPGLPENALQGFGDLNFVYEFKNNLVDSLEVASLHPDWKAYRKVGGILLISYNALKCSCAELAWLGNKEGFGKEFSALDDFHEKFLNKENNNICIDSPCTLPVDAVRHMIIKNGKCVHNFTMQDLCYIYFPTTTTSKPTLRPGINLHYTTPYLQFFKRARLPINSKSKGFRLNTNHLNIIVTIIVVLIIY